MEWYEEPYCRCQDWEPCLCGMGEPHCGKCCYRLPEDALTMWLEARYGTLGINSP